MSDEWAEFEAYEVLRVLGRLRMPEPRVLEDARESLWSAIAVEMPGTGRTTRRREASQSPAERRMSLGGGEAPER
jgi:hypothetical protein